MRTLYIDSDYKLHVENAEGMASVETENFDGFCPELVECYRFIPAHDGHDTFIQPWKDTIAAEKAQIRFEAQAEIEDMKTALNELGVNVNG